MSSSFVVKTFIFIETDIHINTYTSIQISNCGQNETMVSDDSKRNLRHFNMKIVELAQFFHIKMKEY